MARVRVLSPGEKRRIREARTNGGSRFTRDDGSVAYLTEITADMMNDIGPSSSSGDSCFSDSGSSDGGSCDGGGGGE